MVILFISNLNVSPILRMTIQKCLGRLKRGRDYGKRDKGLV